MRRHALPPAHETFAGATPPCAAKRVPGVRFACLACWAALALCAGCFNAPTQGPPSVKNAPRPEYRPPAAAQPANTHPTDTQPAASGPAGFLPAGDPSANTTAAASQPAGEATTPPTTDPALEIAKAGVDGKGEKYGGGVITEPVRVYFRVPQHIVFNVEIPKALQLYKATSADGKGPKSHDEFMQKIIAEGGIRLPEPKPGDQYWYDAEAEQLMIRRAKRP